MRWMLAVFRGTMNSLAVDSSSGGGAARYRSVAASRGANYRRGGADDCSIRRMAGGALSQWLSDIWGNHSSSENRRANGNVGTEAVRASAP